MSLILECIVIIVIKYHSDVVDRNLVLKIEN